MAALLKSFSHGSTLQSTILTNKLAKRAKELGYSSVALTDIGNVSQIIQHYKECLKHKIKPIFGITLNLCQNYLSETYFTTLLCKNRAGWQTLLKIIEKSYDPKNYRHGPRISIADLQAFDVHNLFCLLGGYNSSMQDVLLLHKIFNKNLILCLSFANPEYNQSIYHIASELGIGCIGTAEPFYLEQADYRLHELVLCTYQKVKIDKLERMPSNNFFLVAPESI